MYTMDRDVMNSFSTAIIAMMVSVAAMITVGCSDIATGGADGRTRLQFDTLELSHVKVPNDLSFCGERVPIEIPEVYERAERELLLNLQSPGQIMLYLKRSGRYFPMYERVLKEERLPDDLKYVSVAESALFMARSAKDAVGLWQFIAPTAKSVGLIVDEYVDERRHPEKSTHAACTYLRNGYKANGSWTNAVAGYNMGHENFDDNIRFQGSKNYYDLYLNEETSRYVLRIAVIKHIMEHAHEYGIIVPQEARYKPDPPTLVKVTEAIPDLAQWAKANGSTYKDVKLLNPWILKRSLPAPKTGAWYVAM